MKGTVIGDVVGSHYEFESTKGLTLPLFVEGRSSFTDDTVLAIATAAKLMGMYETYAEAYKATFHKFKNMDSNGNGSVDMGYGDRFQTWAFSDSLEPYGSLGNGSAMRVSPIAYIATSKEELMQLAKESAEATHDTPEAIFAAQAVALAVYRSLEGVSAEDIQKEIAEDSIEVHGKRNLYTRDFSLSFLHRKYKFTALAYESVPHAISIGLSATSFEEALRYCLYIGGDTDTIASIAGAIAEARLGIPDDMEFLVDPLERHAPEYYKIMREFYYTHVVHRLPRAPKKLSKSRMLGYYISDMIG